MDWFEAMAILGGEARKLQFFAMRSMGSGDAFHRAYPHATQQALLEAHEHAFAYFGGVFKTLRYDNMTSVVKKILRGYCHLPPPNHQRDKLCPLPRHRSAVVLRVIRVLKSSSNRVGRETLPIQVSTQLRYSKGIVESFRTVAAIIRLPQTVSLPRGASWWTRKQRSKTA